eukprot:SAG31_NODE_88_length_26714_cov_6.972046_20_plen_395_part_00
MAPSLVRTEPAAVLILCSECAIPFRRPSFVDGASTNSPETDRDDSMPQKFDRGYGSVEHRGQKAAEAELCATCTAARTRFSQPVQATTGRGDAENPMLFAAPLLGGPASPQKQTALRRGCVGCGFSCGHSHGRPGATKTTPSLRLLVVGCITTIAGVVQFSVGRALDIRAVQADGAHMMADTIFVMVAWLATLLARRGFGSRMIGSKDAGGPVAEVLALSLNLAAITLILSYLGAESAAELFSNQPARTETAARIMLLLGSVSLGVQLVNAALLHAFIETSPGARAVFLHAILDCISSTGVIVGAIIAIWAETTKADAAVSLLIAIVAGLSFAKVLAENITLMTHCKGELASTSDSMCGRSKTIRILGHGVAVATAVGIAVTSYFGWATQQKVA